MDERTLVWEALVAYDGEALGTFEHGEDPWLALSAAKELHPDAKFVRVVGEVK